MWVAGSELTQPTPESVADDEHGVHVTVVTEQGTRVVTCDRVWEDRLREVVANTPPGHRLTTPWRESAATARGSQQAISNAQHADQPIVRFSARSLRNTWLVARLTEGTPVPTLLDAAGVESIEALKAFLPYVPQPTPEERAATLRGGCPTDTPSERAEPGRPWVRAL